ncbi:MAG: 3'-5' exonuclease [Sarcina sp.]
MGYIILDLEFNNMQNITKYYPHIYEKNRYLRTLEVQNEIIQIGAVKLDDDMKQIDSYKVYTKSCAFPVLNPIITNITGIKYNDLKNAKTLKEGLIGLKKFVGTDNIVCSWATDDIAEIVINAKYQGYDDVFWIEKYLDLQNYCTKLLSYKKPIGLKVALAELKIDVDQTKLHDALNDSIYTAEVLRTVYDKEKIEKAIVDDVYVLPALKIKDLRKHDPSIINMDFKCEKCKTDLTIVEPLALLVNKFVSLGKCDTCDSKYLQEVTLRKNIAGGIIYSDIITTLDNFEYFNYSYKFKSSRKK